jgi:N6-L-threonylcarbamoyladenine synthase
VISGGHTDLYLCKDILDFEVLGRTRDDAVGEAFDKVGKILDLGYPGGPLVEKKASSFKGKDIINFPFPILKNSQGIDFSFSGIKTAVLYYWRGSSQTESEKDKICYSFQKKVVEIIASKLKDAIDQTGIKNIVVGGGVLNNELLRRELLIMAERNQAKLYLPEKEYCSDNAAMCAAYGESLFKRGVSSDYLLNAEPSLKR